MLYSPDVKNSNSLCTYTHTHTHALYSIRVVLRSCAQQRTVRHRHEKRAGRASNNRVGVVLPLKATRLKRRRRWPIDYIIYVREDSIVVYVQCVYVYMCVCVCVRFLAKKRSHHCSGPPSTFSDSFAQFDANYETAPDNPRQIKKSNKCLI